MSIRPFITIAELKALLDKKEITSSEVLDFYLRRFEAYDKDVQSALEVFEKNSIFASSSQEGELAGIPGIIKDNICQKDRITSCGSKILENFTSTYDATAVKRMKDAGALLIGRANCDEFAMGSSGETSAYQKTKNPWDHSRVPGGSSSGSIAAVAAGLTPWSFGSETGGSVRQPAAFCGIVGLKPTYGLISRYGLVAYGSSVDQIGIATHTAYDAAMVLSAAAGHDALDSSTLTIEKKDYTKNITDKLPGKITIGVLDNALNAAGMDSQIVAAIEDAIAEYEKMGATIKRISIPSFDYSAAVYFVLSRAEAASNLARYDGVRYGMRDKTAKSLMDMYLNTRHDGFGQEVKTRIMVGNYVLSSGFADKYYANACKVRSMMAQDLTRTFKDVNVLLLPTHPAPAFEFNAFENDKLQMDLQDYFTCAANLTGVPAISIPGGFSKDNLPIGFQLMGPHLSEELLFQVAHAYQQVTDWHTKHPTG